MNLTIAGGEAYAITGGMQIESCEILSKSNWAYKSVHPAISLQLRDADDKKPVWMSTIFGKTIDINGNTLPLEDTRPKPEYVVYTGSAIECYEVTVTTAHSILSSALKLASTLKKIELLTSCLNVSDLTEMAIDRITSYVEAAWTDISSITAYNGNDNNIAVTGFPMLETFSYAYDNLVKSGKLRVKLIKE